MERCSYFIENKALFGGFPTQEIVKELENMGVRYFVDLTRFNESKTTPYCTHYEYIHYPIMDHSIPRDLTDFVYFIAYIGHIINILEEGELIYIHCKGGHGRSGVVVASLLCSINKITPDESIKLTSEYHSRRTVMREKWRIIGSPQTRHQKMFVHKFYEANNQ
jgi:protein-tyrosine phosphatase